MLAEVSRLRAELQVLRTRLAAARLRDEIDEIESRARKRLELLELQARIDSLGLDLEGLAVMLREIPGMWAPRFADSGQAAAFLQTLPPDMLLEATRRMDAAARAPRTPPADAAGTASAAVQDRSNPHQVTPPDQAACVICYAGADQAYGFRLTEQVRRAGLPAWSVADLRPGEDWSLAMREHLARALAVVVVMSPQSQESEVITRMILEGQRHDRPFFPVLLHGERNYLLAGYWQLDARDGRLPGEDEIAVLRRWYEAQLAGEPVDAARVPGSLARSGATEPVPRDAALSRLDGYLRDGETQHADLLTTTMLLDAAGRLTYGWLPRESGESLPGGLLTEIDAAWARHTGGRQGFQAQRSLARLGARTGHREFVRLSVAFGWRDANGSAPARYGEFARRAGAGDLTGFFPTLRNAHNEIYPNWYDRWTGTVLAVHARLRSAEVT
jgi:hypothetical protein